MAGTAGHDGVQDPPLSQNLPAPLLFSLFFFFPRLHPSQHPFPHPSPRCSATPFPHSRQIWGDKPRLPASPLTQEGTFPSLKRGRGSPSEPL